MRASLGRKVDAGIFTWVDIFDIGSLSEEVATGYIDACTEA